MHANSRPVSSNQAAIHEQLAALVDKHIVAAFRKPIAAVNAEAFERSLAAWRSHGSAPLILDAGCGVGLSTRRLARLFPDNFVIGVDQSADRLQRLVHWPDKTPDNFALVRADLVDYWRLLAMHGLVLERHYLLYPNPWPKKSQLARRWHGHPVFPVLASLGGVLECRSNWRIYVEEFSAALAQVTGLAIACEPYQASPTSALTPFEEKYARSGHHLWRCSALLPVGTHQKALSAS